MKIRQDIAEALRAGHTYRQIREQFRVSSKLIAHIRKTLDIPVPKRTKRPITPAEQLAWMTQRHSRAIAMLRAGATYAEVTRETGTTAPTLVRLRKLLQIPLPRHRAEGGKGWTITEAFAYHTQPYGDGHLRWTGHVSTRGQRVLCAGSERRSPLRVSFHLHHRRDPIGKLLPSCEEPDCIAGRHLTDNRIREANARADTAFDVIFPDPA
ncbi:hypothetical protein ABZ890_12060 [Streptomyces sp. NPDC046984]|uniref:hypothetical protein n=1 Tax=Streptomyces sp. NPDC046984 TaxID=3155138 RepID=UPI0033CF83E1